MRTPIFESFWPFLAFWGKKHQNYNKMIIFPITLVLTSLYKNEYWWMQQKSSPSTAYLSFSSWCCSSVASCSLITSCSEHGITGATWVFPQGVDIFLGGLQLANKRLLNVQSNSQPSISIFNLLSFVGLDNFFSISCQYWQSDFSRLDKSIFCSML